VSVDDREHTQQLINASTQRLRRLELRKAQLGMSADVSIEMEIDQIREQIEIMQSKLGGMTGRMLAPNPQPSRKHRGLIVLVGPGRLGDDPMSQSAADAITYHLAVPPDPGLERCWLVAGGTDKSGRSAITVAEQLKQLCTEKGVRASIFSVGDSFNIYETFNLVQWIYSYEVRPSNLAEHEVIADFTGCVKPMSVGMILACGGGRPSQYMVRGAVGQPSTPLLLQLAADVA